MLRKHNNNSTQNYKRKVNNLSKEEYLSESKKILDDVMNRPLSKLDVYAIYLRKSRADIEAEKLGEGETLARHKKILTDLAARKGLYIGKIYQEIVSGETIEARPQIQELIHDCYAGKYRGIIIIEVTRLSRGNQGDAQIILDCLKYSNNNNGLLVITPTKTYDIVNSQDDERFLEFELFMSRQEYKMIRKRMESGRIQAVVEGNYMGSYRPYGYDILKTKTSRTLIPNPEEAPIVKKIFEWSVNDNITPGKIARKLTVMGVPTYSGEAEWNIATVKTILTNPTYTGKVRWNDRMQVKTMVDGKIISSRPRSNHTTHYMEYEGKHKKHALVTEEMFKAASEKFYSDKTKHNFKLKNPLAGLIVCPKCGKAMMYQSNESKNTPARLLHAWSHLCNTKSAIVQDVVNAVVHALSQYIDDFSVKLDKLPDVDEKSIVGEIAALETEIKKIEKKLSKLFDAWENETITDNEFVKRKAVNVERIDSIRSQIVDLENSIPEKEEYEEKIMGLSDALNALKDDTLDADIKNVYLKAIIEKIEYSRESKEEFILDIYLR